MNKSKSAHQELSILNLLIGFSIIVLLSSCIPSGGITTSTLPQISIPQNIFYVEGKFGSDSNTGLQAQPWKTIQKAADTIDAGDTVMILHGDYAERVRVAHSGVAGAPITFQAEGQVIMKGFTVKANYITIRGFEITDTPNNDTDGVGISVQASYCDIENNYIHYATRGGITITPNTSDCLIRGNRIYRNGHHGIEVDGKNHLIENNEIWGTIQYHPNWINPPLTADADGIRFFGSGHVFRGNYIHDILLSDPYNINPHIDAFQTWDSSVGLEVANHIIFEKNIISLRERSAGWQLGGATHDLIIRNNIVEVYDAGIRGYAVNESPYNLLILNNIFIGKLSVSPIGVTITSGTNITFKNNIILDQKNKTLEILGHGNDVAYNLAYNSDGSIPPAPNGVSLVNSFWGINPLFMNPLTTNYHLKTGSPAIDAGAPLLDVKDDFDGIARPQGVGYDIGPYEYSR